MCLFSEDKLVLHLTVESCCVATTEIRQVTHIKTDFVGVCVKSLV